jgi:2-dehydro-3-deoxyphosphogalactonate aldolase
MDLDVWIEKCPLIAILRGVEPREAESIGEALFSAGFSMVEVPLNSPAPFESIAILSRAFGSRMLVGAGTVTHWSQVAGVASAGGRLIVSPHADREIVRAAWETGLASIPGFFNPTEAFSLLEAGADAIKLFPAEVLGVGMLKALRVVLPSTARVVPVGGVDVGNLGTWMAAGAAGLGIGSALYKPGDKAAQVKAKALEFVAAVRGFQAGQELAEQGIHP